MPNLRRQEAVPLPNVPDDDLQAELETEFTHDVFMKENEGFLNLYEYTKDALMQKNVSGRDVKMWVSMKAEESGMIDNFNLISHLRIPVGL